MARQAKPKTELTRLEDALPALNITPHEGENLVTFGERLCDTFKVAFTPFIEELKDTYGAAVAVYGDADSVNVVKEGHKLAVNLRTTIAKEGVEQRRPLRDLVSAHKAAEDEVIEQIKPVEKHLKEQVDSIEKREQEERRKLTMQRVEQLQEAGFTRNDQVIVAHMVVLMIDTLADLTEEQFAAKIEEGKAQIAEQQAIEQRRKEAEEAMRAQQQALLEKEREIERLRAELAAAKGAPSPAPESNGLTPPEELQLPPMRPSAPQPSEAPPAQAEPQAEAPQPAHPVTGPGLRGELTGKEKNQSWINGFREAQRLAAEVTLDPEMKSKTMIREAILALQP